MSAPAESATPTPTAGDKPSERWSLPALTLVGVVAAAIVGALATISPLAALGLAGLVAAVAVALLQQTIP
ncbi:MAG: hypothetical protein JSS68_14120 [Actinobacteria bacterium]|nr:hypothetical protein [Actinomycetota bacterium]MBS1884335.1 hypothetical protein [Actinomycetota bacterium]